MQTEAQKIAQKKYRDKNRGKRAMQSKAWRERNKEKVKEYQNSEKEIERKRRYREENREKLRESNKRYREENKEKEIQRRIRYSTENSAKKKECQKAYKKSDIGRLKHIQHESKRRALKLSTDDGTITTESLIELRNSTQLCSYCECELNYNKENAVHLDHIIPLSKGGTHSLTNVQWICKSCNLSKGSTIIEKCERAS